MTLTGGNLITQERQYQFTNELGDAVLLGKGTYYRVLKVTGLLDWPDRIGSSDIYGDRHGGFQQGGDYMGIRRMTLELAVRPEVHGDIAAATTEAYLADLTRVFARGLGDGVFAVRRQRRRADNIGYTKRIYCHAKRTEFPATWDVATGLARGLVELEATDPLVYDNDLTTYSVGLVQATGGRTYDRVYPLVYSGGSGSGGLVTVVHSGDMDVHPIIRIYGPADTPIVRHVGQGKFLKFNVVVPDDAYLEVDMFSHSVLLNGTANYRGYLDPLSEWFVMEPGSNDILFSANVYDASAALEIDFRSAWATA